MTTTQRAIDLAALDMAGTTIEDHGLVYATLRAVVEEHLRRPVPEDTFGRWTGTSKRAAIEGLLRECGGDAADTDTVYAAFGPRLRRAYAEQPPTIVPGVSEALAQLRAAGVAVVLQTGYSREEAELILDAVGWQVGRDLDGLVPSDEVAASRPAPDLIRAAMALTGVSDPARVLAAGDTPNDLGAAESAGVGYAIGVLSGHCSRTELEALPHTHVLPSVADVPRLVLGG